MPFTTRVCYDHMHIYTLFHMIIVTQFKRTLPFKAYQCMLLQSTHKLLFSYCSITRKHTKVQTNTLHWFSLLPMVNTGYAFFNKRSVRYQQC